MSEPPCKSEPENISKSRKYLNNLLLYKKIFWILTILILVSDLWTKDVAFSFFDEKVASGDIYPGGIYSVSGDWFGLVQVYNSGGPWGVGGAFPVILRYCRILALFVILYILMNTPKNQKLQILSLGLVMGGALGNIYDSCTIGKVRDFLYFDFDIPPADPWPAFNLADSSICVGVFLLALSLIVASFLNKDKEKGETKEQKQ